MTYRQVLGCMGQRRWNGINVGRPRWGLWEIGCVRNGAACSRCSHPKSLYDLCPLQPPVPTEGLRLCSSPLLVQLGRLGGKAGSDFYIQLKRLPSLRLAFKCLMSWANFSVCLNPKNTAPPELREAPLLCVVAWCFSFQNHKTPHPPSLPLLPSYPPLCFYSHRRDERNLTYFCFYSMAVRRAGLADYRSFPVCSSHYQWNSSIGNIRSIDKIKEGHICSLTFFFSQWRN